MKLQAVESSNIEALGHNGNVLRVKFKSGAIYDYDGVPKEVFEEVKSGASIGRTFNSVVKSKPDIYPFTRVA